MKTITKVNLYIFILSTSILSTSLSFAASTYAETLSVSGDRLNLRNQRNTNALIRCQLNQKDRLIRLRRYRGWYRVLVDQSTNPNCKNLEGFVADDYVVAVDTAPSSANIKSPAARQISGSTPPLPLRKPRKAAKEHQRSDISSFYHSKTVQMPNLKSNAPRNNRWKRYGQIYDRLFGIPAYSSGRRRRSFYQCTENVHRFLNAKFRTGTKKGMGLGHANRLISGIYRYVKRSKRRRNRLQYKGRPVQIVRHRNWRASEPPMVGSAINFSIGRNGHIAIVRYIEKRSKNTLRLYLFEQHGLMRFRYNQIKPLRFITMKKRRGKWGGSYKRGIGLPLRWLNFRYQ